MLRTKRLKVAIKKQIKQKHVWQRTYAAIDSQCGDKPRLHNWHSKTAIAWTKLYAFASRQNVIFAIIKFNRRLQKPGEAIDTHSTRTPIDLQRTEIMLLSQMH